MAAAGNPPEGSEGELDVVEAAFIRNLMNFRKIKTRDIMTPRTVVATAPGTATFREFYDMQDYAKRK